MPSEHDAPEWDDEDEPEDEAIMDDLLDHMEPHPSAAAIVEAAPIVAPPAPPPPPAPKAGDRWHCSKPGCNATWTGKAPTHHTHTEPVAGSKSRVTHTNFKVSKAQ